MLISVVTRQLDVLLLDFCFCYFHCHYVKMIYLLDSRWEEERYTDGVKWKFLEHKGPVFAPAYEPLPSHVKFYYDGKALHSSSCTLVKDSEVIINV